MVRLGAKKPYDLNRLTGTICRLVHYRHENATKAGTGSSCVMI